MPKGKRKGNRKHKKITFNQRVNMLDVYGYPYKAKWNELYFTVDGTGDLQVYYENGGTPNWVSIGTSSTNSIPSIASLGAGAGFVFRLSDVVANTEFDVMYDAYKLLKIHCQIDLLTDYLGASNASQRGLIPEVYIANDYDDGTAPSTSDVLKQYNNVRLKRLTSNQPSIHTSFTPRNSVNVYKTSGTTIGYQHAKSGWVDCTYTDVEFYGLKMYFQNIISNFSGCPLIRVQFSGDYLFKTRR